MTNIHYLHLRLLSLLIVFGLIFGLGLSACTPSEPHRQASIDLTQKALKRQQSPIITNAGGHLSRAIGEQTEHRPSLSGYYPISTGANAFATRSILTSMATATIDVQYYIWHNDAAGQLLLKNLWQAAERGVLVRLLLDDFNGNQELDELLARFARHPNIAVRLINPAHIRSARPLSFFLSPQGHRRMHNKSMTFDNRISIIGGRNIGNEYLNNDNSNQFADLDVLLVGQVIPAITQSFNEYWQSPLSFDIEALTPAPDGDFNDHLTHLDNPKKSRQANQANHSNQAKDKTNDTHRNDSDDKALTTYQMAVANATIGDDLLNKRVNFRWATMQFISDPVAKLSHQANKPLPIKPLLKDTLKQELGRPKTTLSIISSYFVPTHIGTDELIALQQQGVNVQILTNSYDATDVGVVHAGYSKHRKALLKAGVRLFELKSIAQAQQPNNKKQNRLWRTKGETTTSLHAKTFAIDTHKVFIGSYNTDPRSAYVNTEMGIIIYDNKLAHRLHHAFDNELLTQAYELKLSGDKLQWHTLENGKHIVLDNEPNMQTGDKIGIAVIGKLPIDWLL